MTVKELYSELIFKKIEKLKADKKNLLFVILGQTTLINFDNKDNFLADRETFKLEKDDQVFNKEWFSKIFIILNQHKEFHLLSFAQFSYLISYIDPSFFNERVIIINDNLRRLFPINKHEYLETDEKENIEFRPDKLPCGIMGLVGGIFGFHSWHMGWDWPDFHFNRYVFFALLIIAALAIKKRQDR